MKAAQLWLAFVVSLSFVGIVVGGAVASMGSGGTFVETMTYLVTGFGILLVSMTVGLQTLARWGDADE